MYTTLKTRLRTKGETKALLLLYEKTFHEEIESLYKQLERNHFELRNLEFDSRIHSKCYWILRQLALKQYHANRQHRNFTYNRSSSWAVGAFSLDENVLTFCFGSEFKVQKLRLESLMDEREKELITLGRIIRIDLVHDEKFWYANFILFYEKNSF